MSIRLAIRFFISKTSTEFSQSVNADEVLKPNASLMKQKETRDYESMEMRYIPHSSAPVFRDCRRDHVIIRTIVELDHKLWHGFHFDSGSWL